MFRYILKPLSEILMTSIIPWLSDLNTTPWAERLQHKLDNKTKPKGSLGRLEHLAIQIGSILGTDTPELHQPQLVVFAGDHGLAKHGVSAYPSDVTWQMVSNFLGGGAAVSVLARQYGIQLYVADCGVDHHFEATEGLINCKVALGTADMLQGPAMTKEQCHQALEHGQQIVQRLQGNALLLGEMGIGNTSAASLIMARLTQTPIEQCTGAGTGLDRAGIERKQAILAQALAANAQANTPLDVLAAFGGFEIATMVGAVLQAASDNRVIVVDGFIASSAVLVAAALQPLVLQRCIFAHRSGEQGHTHMLNTLGVRPVLDLELRLGEGSGAALVWPLLQSACAIVREMASFESAGVSRNTESSQ
jgi:nicotinate-nucleotide--dimethylbenzimidazole phosphoribosyltransferase